MFNKENAVSNLLTNGIVAAAIVAWAQPQTNHSAFYQQAGRLLLLYKN